MGMSTLPPWWAQTATEKQGLVRVKMARDLSDQAKAQKAGSASGLEWPRARSKKCTLDREQESNTGTCTHGWTKSTTLSNFGALACAKWGERGQSTILSSISRLSMKEIIDKPLDISTEILNKKPQSFNS